jgi:hypothetical protein
MDGLDTPAYSPVPIHSRPSRSGLVEEIQAVANELFRVLEECTVTRVGIHDQLSLPDALGHQERVVGWDHHVVRPVHDENRLLDFAEPRERRFDTLGPG